MASNRCFFQHFLHLDPHMNKVARSVFAAMNKVGPKKGVEVSMADACKSRVGSGAPLWSEERLQVRWPLTAACRSSAFSAFQEKLAGSGRGRAEAAERKDCPRSRRQRGKTLGFKTEVYRNRSGKKSESTDDSQGSCSTA